MRGLYSFPGKPSRSGRSGQGAELGALGDGGQVQLPLTETFFSPRFGMLADKFGVNWMIVTAPAEAKAPAE